LGGVARKGCSNHALVFGRLGPLSRDGVEVFWGGMGEIGESIRVNIIDE